jgi:CO/xanthine dehydrogenase FAD-binding subunit
VTAATPRPLLLRFAGHPEPGEALAALDAAVSADGAVPRYLDDVHGSAPWRAAMTRRCVAEVIAELARSPGPAR